MTYFPLGRKSLSSGVSSLTFCQSSIVRSRPKARAMAIEWSTALVEPPNTIVSRIALIKLWRVTMSRGLRSSSSSFRMAAPERKHSSIFSAESAGAHEEYGSDNPMHSMNEDMVLAVYIPPQAPWPGQDLPMISLRSSSEIDPASFWP